MRTRRDTSAWVLVVVAGVGALLAACGDDDETVAPTSSTEASSTSAPAGDFDIDVFLLPASTGTDCSEVVAAHRVATDEGVLGSALEQLLAGPNESERTAGLDSWFSTKTAGMLNSVVVEDGVARIDFDDFDGSPEAFYEWLQLSAPTE
jgi:hypothetical protein